MIIKYLRPSLSSCLRSVLSCKRKNRNSCLFANQNTRNYSTTKLLELEKFPPERIRNFGIIAHVDHGKSTLADRLLELTGVISATNENKQVLDKLSVEKERGITVKAQTCSLFYNYNGEEYLINLIDTPGHVDFHYEVSRSLAACQGVLLLVDSTQGVQAQTLANFFLAFGEDLTIIPVVNKIDMLNADIEKVQGQMTKLFDFGEDEFLHCSAKTGVGVDDILPAIIERVPCPKPLPNNTPPNQLKAFLFDTWYSVFRGTCMLIKITEGKLGIGDIIVSASNKKKYEVSEVGIMSPELVPAEQLNTGQVGYIYANVKNPKEIAIGDTFYRNDYPVDPHPGFKEAKPMVFCGIYPVENATYEKMKNDIEKLKLTDNSVTVQNEASLALGNGWRLGFLGTLHMEVFIQRLEEDFEANVITTAPSVCYKVEMRNGDMLMVQNPGDFPDPVKIKQCFEPMIMGTLIAPSDYLGKLMNLCNERRGLQEGLTWIDNERVMIKFKLPLAEIATDFLSAVKSISSGYASFDYEDADFEPVDLIKIDTVINGNEVDVLACITNRENATQISRSICTKLREALSRQLVDIVIQGKIGGKVLAREQLKAVRKDVTAKCYGGDVTRKMKLLNKQKEGKKKMMKMIGNVEVPKKAFLSVLKRN